MQPMRGRHDTHSSHQDAADGVNRIEQHRQRAAECVVAGVAPKGRHAAGRLARRLTSCGWAAGESSGKGRAGVVQGSRPECGIMPRLQSGSIAFGRAGAVAAAAATYATSSCSNSGPGGGKGPGRGCRAGASSKQREEQKQQQQLAALQQQLFGPLPPSSSEPILASFSITWRRFANFTVGRWSSVVAGDSNFKPGFGLEVFSLLGPPEDQDKNTHAKTVAFFAVPPCVSPPLSLLQFDRSDGQGPIIGCCIAMQPHCSHGIMLHSGRNPCLPPARPFPEHSPATQQQAPRQSTSSMSTFWSDACNSALGRSLPVLLNAVYAVGGVLVRRVCVVSPAHRLHGVAPLDRLCPAAGAAA